MQITATFAAGTDPDIAQVQVQNKVQQAIPRLPEEVRQRGLTVQKSQSGFQLIIGAVRYDRPLHQRRYRRLPGEPPAGSDLPGARRRRRVGVRLPYAMRIWLDPYKLVSFDLTPADVRDAVQAQNAQVAAGELGAQPAMPEQQLNATVTAQSRLQTPEQFRNIILKTTSDGAVVRLSDVARVELGADSYDVLNRLNGQPAAGMPVRLAPGANALTTIDAVKARALELAKSLPEGMKLSFPVDNTRFIRISIREVIVHPDGGHRAGHPGDVPVPAELARDPDSRRSRFRWCCWARSARWRRSATPSIP